MIRALALAATALTLFLSLSACGVDGPPTPPADPPPETSETRPTTGITISGTVGVGVAGGSTRIR